MRRKQQVLEEHFDKLVTNTVEMGTVVLMPDAALEQGLADYSDEEIETIADAWQTYAGKRYKNMIVAEEEDAQPA